MSKLNTILKTIILSLVLLQIAPPIIKSFSKSMYQTIDPKNKVGLITICNPITSSTGYCKQLKTFFKDPEIKAILLKMNCPGGAAGSSEAIAQEILELKKNYPKPIVTYCENLCASGAYMIAATTDHIVATSSALLGSIGAKLETLFKLKKLCEKYDLETHEVVAGTYKNSCNPFTEMTSEQEKMMQNLVDSSYQNFIHFIAKQRHLNINQEHLWAQDQIFSGTDGLKLRLIDEIGNESIALAYIKKHILHENYEIELINHQKKSLISKLFKPTDDCDQDDSDNIEQSLSKKLWSNLLQHAQHYQLSF